MRVYLNRCAGTGKVNVCMCELYAMSLGSHGARHMFRSIGAFFTFFASLIWGTFFFNGNLLVIGRSSLKQIMNKHFSNVI